VSYEGNPPISVAFCVDGIVAILIIHNAKYAENEQTASHFLAISAMRHAPL
jgi:hypothetical protein